MWENCKQILAGVFPPGNEPATKSDASDHHPVLSAREHILPMNCTIGLATAAVWSGILKA
jgi:hypothetical protein